MLHNSSDLKNKKGLRLLNELNKLKKIISKIGVSIYEINEYEFLKKKFKFDIIQFPF